MYKYAMYNAMESGVRAAACEGWKHFRVRKRHTAHMTLKYPHLVPLCSVAVFLSRIKNQECLEM